VLLYDEPTTGLDPIAMEHITDLIVQLNERYRVTSVVVTHDMPSAFRVSDRIAMIDRGYIIFEGTPDDVRYCEDPRVRDFIEGNAPESDDTETLLRYGG
jgi:phospholipid/cholesterol/gamma-HCH transport system ATP-binding protein